MKMSAKPPLVIHIFSPFNTQLPSSWRVARVRAASASEPDPDSLSAYAPTVSPDTSPGRYFAFCASVPNRTSGMMQRFACAPYAAPSDADRAICSETTSADTLSRSSPPYCSGTLIPSRPSSPARLMSARASAQSFVSS